MLTPAQKIAAYQYALERQSIHAKLICFSLDMWLDYNGLSDTIVPLKDLFPEFHAQMPITARAAWWPLDESGRLIRIDVLTKAIANVKP